MKLKIKVDKDCLEKSKNCNSMGLPSEHKIGQNCAIARAICDVLPNSWVSPWSIYFFKEEITFSDKGFIEKYRDVEIELPNEARIFISKFDQSSPSERANMPEIEFEIDVPDEIINTIGDMEEVKRLISSSKTLELV